MFVVAKEPQPVAPKPLVAESDDLPPGARPDLSRSITAPCMSCFVVWSSTVDFVNCLSA